MTPKSLLASIALPASTVDKRGTLPILGCLRIADGRVTANDLEREISATIDLDLSCCVPAGRFQAALKALPPECELRLDMQEHRLRIRGGRSKFMIPTLPVEDFPNFEWSEPEEIIESPTELAAAVRTAAPAMAVHDVRFYLIGVATQNGAINGTNGHWAAKHECNALPDGIIIPRASVPMVLSALDEETVRFSVNERNLHIAANGYRMSTKLVEGKFPDVNRYWRIEHHRNAWTVSRDEFITAVLSVRGMRQDKSSIGRVKVADGSMSFHAERNGEEAEATISVDGPAHECGFDYSYLLAAAKVLDGTQLTMSQADTGSTLVMTGDNDAQRVVIMPARV